MKADDDSGPFIGVFDSGVGGLTVLRALRARLPGVALRYIGDTAHAPYGSKPADEIVARCLAVVDHYQRAGSRLVVVACNTATAHAISVLRDTYPDIDFVGVEPGIKPAIARSRNARIAVLTTPATAASARLQALIRAHGAAVQVHVEACPTLAATIERGHLTGPELLEVLQPHCDAVRRAEVDTVVLGCTHYPFVSDAISGLLGPEIALIDTAVAVAERAASRWSMPLSASRPDQADRPDQIVVSSTARSPTMERLLAQCTGLEGLRVGTCDL